MIPVIINTRDVMYSVQAQVKFFLQCPEAYVIILDNDSTYPPLREWYDTLRSSSGCHPDIHAKNQRWIFHNREGSRMLNQPHELYLFPGNSGPRAGSTLVSYFDKPFDYYFLSDADMGYSDCDPETILKDLQDGLERYPKALGAGVSIRIDDLPATEMAKLARETEADRWLSHPTLTYDTFDPETRQEFYIGGDDPHWYNAACDTAGVLRRFHPAWDGGYDGIRSTKHIAQHRPWYFIPPGFTCPVCKIGTNIQEPEVYCEGCETGINMPPDFAHYYSRANPHGTCYTAFQLDDTRRK